MTDKKEPVLLITESKIWDDIKVIGALAVRKHIPGGGLSHYYIVAKQTDNFDNNWPFWVESKETYIMHAFYTFLINQIE